MKKVVTLCALALLSSCGGEARDLPIAEIDCRNGVYTSAEGELLSLTALTENGYRWRTLDGRTGAAVPDGDGWRATRGWTREGDGTQIELGDCSAGTLRLGPEGAPLAVHIHGSQRWSSLRSNAMPLLLAAQGIASFVYDKRGTGQSEGAYTQDFRVLAGDAIAALEQARALAGDRITSAGFVGHSQGGWIGPLAASQSNVDYVVALYGLAEGALAEDRSQVMLDVAQAGFGPGEQARAAEISDAAGAVIASGFREGFAEFDRVRQLYRNEPWYGAVQGEFTGEMLPYPEFLLRIFGPMNDEGTSWDYDPMSVLPALETPQFWMLAANDAEAPPQETIRRLRAMQAEGRPIDLAIYPNSDHGMIMLEPAAEGPPNRVGYVQDFYRQVAAWITARDLSYAANAGAEVYLATSRQTPTQ